MAITRFPLETDEPVVEVNLPPGRHVLELVVEDSAGLRSEPDTVTITIENVLPVITAIDPATKRQGVENLRAVITGAYLENVRGVSFLGDGITVESFDELSSEELAVVLTVAPDAAPGPRRFTVTTDQGSVESPSGVTFTVEEGLPVITGIVPNSRFQGENNLNVVIQGSNLVDVESVQFDGSGITVRDFSELSEKELSVFLDIGSTAATGERIFLVETKSGEAKSPIGVGFTVLKAAGLEIIGIVPKSGSQGKTNLNVVIQGNDLVDVESVQFDGSGITVRDFSELNEKALSVFLDIGSTAATGERSFVVETRSDRAKSPPGVVFTVIRAEKPTILPTIIPTFQPTIRPTIEPTIRPTISPTISPTFAPTIRPTISPTFAPTIRPTISPTFAPTIRPTISPTISPTIRPTISPPIDPTISPTFRPTISPTFRPIMTTFKARDFPGRSVEEVTGIGPATAELLKAKRITNLAHLASMEPGKLAEILPISEVRAMEFIDQARRLLTEEE